MNDELQKQVASILQSALHAAQQGGHWLAGQLPDVLHQLILWTIWRGIVMDALFAVGLTVGLLAMFQWSDQRPDYGNWRTAKIICSTITTLWIVIAGAFAVGYSYDALQALIAPKLFLLEYAASFISH